MKLSIPCNWDPELLNQFPNNTEICEMTGALNVTPVGSGRPSLITGVVEKTDAARFVESVHRKGWRFSFLLNAPCMGNMEYDIRVHKALIKHLDWLGEIGVDTITVTIPYLIELIKKQFPRFRVRVSTIAGVGNTKKAQYFEDLGADDITVDYMQNRNFEFLSKLKEAVCCDLVLLVNDACLYQCPFRSYHYNACGHASQDWDPLGTYYMDYSMVRCMIEKLKKPERLLAMPWIRPEDLSHYEALGYHMFKLSGRHMPTNMIAKAVKAYSSRQFDGNLMEILNPFVEEGEKRIPYVDNKTLDGFLDHLKACDCNNNCHRCNLCESTARRAIRVDSECVNAHLMNLEGHIDGLTSSRFLPKPK